MNTKPSKPAEVVDLNEHRANKRLIGLLEERAHELNIDLRSEATAEALRNSERTLRAAAAASHRFDTVEVVTQCFEDMLKKSVANDSTVTQR